MTLFSLRCGSRTKNKSSLMTVEPLTLKKSKSY